MVARVAAARRSEFERIVVCVIDDVQIWAVALDAVGRAVAAGWRCRVALWGGLRIDGAGAGHGQGAGSHAG